MICSCSVLVNPVKEVVFSADSFSAQKLHPFMVCIYLYTVHVSELYTVSYMSRIVAKYIVFVLHINLLFIRSVPIVNIDILLISSSVHRRSFI